MLLPRVITSVFGGPILLGAGFVGGAALALLIAFVVVMGTREFHAMQGPDGSPPLDVGLLGGLGLLAAAYIQSLRPWGWAGAHSPQPFVLGGVAALVVVLYALVRCVFDGKGDPMGRAGLGVLTALYVGGLSSTIVLLRGVGEAGWDWFVLAIGTTWSLDVGAYVGGRLFGRMPLMPGLSPKKTVEGALSGFVCAILGAFLLGVWFGRSAVPSLLIGAAAGLVGQVGDLVESALKRHAGVKDSGHLLPGHGGILDRFDSLLFIAPTIYVLVWVFGWG